MAAAWADPPTVRDVIGRAREAQDLHGRVYGGQLAIPSGEALGAEPAVNDPRPPAHSTDASLHRPAEHTTGALDAPLPHDVEPCPLPAPSDDCLTDGEADRRRGASSASRLADGKPAPDQEALSPSLPSAGRVCGRRTHFYGGSCSREWGHPGCCRS